MVSNAISRWAIVIEGPSPGKVSTESVGNRRLFQFAWNCPNFNTKNLTSQEAPQSQANREGWCGKSQKSSTNLNLPSQGGLLGGRDSLQGEVDVSQVRRVRSEGQR